MTINLTDPANQLTAEQLVTLQLRIMSALSFYRQRPEKEARRMAELLELAGAAASELQDCRAAILQESPKGAGAPQNCRSNENVQVLAGNSPATPDGWVMVPIVPTMEMLDEFDSIIDYGAEDSNDAWSRLISVAPKEVG